jgi:hypothetical protein
MNKTNNYSELFDYFEQLTDESKIHFSNTIFSNTLEEVNKVLEDNLFGTIEEYYQMEDSYEDSEFLGEVPENLEGIFGLKKKEDSSGNSPVYVVMDLDNNQVHVYSDQKKEIDRFIYENLFLKGMFFIKNDDTSNRESNDYTEYQCIDILGQLEQDICYN